MKRVRKASIVDIATALEHLGLSPTHCSGGYLGGRCPVCSETTLWLSARYAPVGCRRKCHPMEISRKLQSLAAGGEGRRVPDTAMPGLAWFDALPALYLHWEMRHRGAPTWGSPLAEKRRG